MSKDQQLEVIQALITCTNEIAKNLIQIYGEIPDSQFKEFVNNFAAGITVLKTHAKDQLKKTEKYG